MVRAVVVTQEEVTQLAKELISKGEKPTIGRVRELLGNRGSPNTISRYLKYWRDGEIDHIRNGDEHDLEPLDHNLDSMDAVADFVEPIKVAVKPEVKPEVKPQVKSQSKSSINQSTALGSQPMLENQMAMSDLNTGAVNSAESADFKSSSSLSQHKSHSQVTEQQPTPLQSGSESASQGSVKNSPPHRASSASQSSQSSQSSQPGQSGQSNQVGQIQNQSQNNSSQQGQQAQQQGQQQGQQHHRKDASRNPQGAGNSGHHQGNNSQGPRQNNQQNNQQKSGHSGQHAQNHKQPNHNKSYDKSHDKPHVPRPALMFEDNFPNVYVSENLDTLTTSQLIAKVRRLESILNKEQSRRESADSMARDAKEYAEAVKVQVGARINDIRQSMEMVIDSLQSQLKSMRETAEKDLRFYRESLDKARDKLAQQKATQRNF